jgi:hypothetical protein
MSSARDTAADMASALSQMLLVLYFMYSSGIVSNTTESASALPETLIILNISKNLKLN